MNNSKPQSARTELWMILHRYTGLAIMLFLGLAALTGCILCFDRPLDEALNADLFKREVAALRPIDPVKAADAFAAERPGIQILSLSLNIPNNRNIAMGVGAAPGAPEPVYNQVFLDRESGMVIGGRNYAPGWGRRHIVAGIAEFHYNLLAGTTGRWLMGVMAFAWLVSNLIGFYLTFPKKRPFFRHWKRMWRFSLRSAFARLMLDLHRASGLWLLIGITLLALTSVALNFYEEIYEPAVVKISPLKRSLFDQPAPFPDGAKPTLKFGDALRLAEAQAAKSDLEWLPATALYTPSWDMYGVTFTDNGRLNYHALGPVYYYFDAATGEFAHEVNPYTDSAGLVMIRILYPLHSGRIGGTLTIAIIFILGLATLEMCVTGAYVWWKKRASRMAARRARKRAQPAK